MADTTPRPTGTTTAQPAPRPTTRPPPRTGAAVTAFTITSSAFANGKPIPARHAGDGRSPPLSWAGAPDRTKCWALIAEDPDAPAGTWTHWTFWNLPADVTSLQEGADVVTLGATQGTTSAKAKGYHGPAPPSGTHRYFFRLYALSAPLQLAAGASVEELRSALSGRVLGQAELMGTYPK